MKKISLFLLSVLCALPACDNSPTGGGGSSVEPTLDNLWPNPEGATWDYDIDLRWWAGNPMDGLTLTTYDDPGDVPEPPSIDEILAAFDDEVGGSIDAVQTGRLHLELGPEFLLDLEITAQEMTRDLTWDDWRAGFFTNGADPFDHRQPYGGLLFPYFIHGYRFWIKTDAEIYSVSDPWIGGTWKFLEADLDPGHEFGHIVLEGSDLTLHCRVLGEVRFNSAETGLVHRALKCLYVLDSGVVGITGDSPEAHAWGRWFDVGMVIYAPEIGPVYSYERKDIDSGDAELRGRGDITLTLTGSSQLD